ncbi:helix-turn-helix domain-containing protein [Allorhizobium undicola]|uniref:helix-turn-helix domain-containing protein n=1 Tax=Allorhizobium undicola TaxID=78527 RepID=UPI003D33ECDA
MCETEKPIPEIVPGLADRRAIAAGDGVLHPRHTGKLEALCQCVLAIIEEMLGMTEAPAEGRGSRRRRCHARQMGMYLCHVALGIPQSDVARALGYDRSTVSYACHVVEDRREDRAMDQFLQRVERVVATLKGLCAEKADG